MELEKLRFPVGRLNYTGIPSAEERQELIKHIEEFPSNMRQAVQGLSKEQLEWRYRPDGWNIRQVVHHVADSHMNALIRFKLAISEDKPTIKPYFEDRWAKHPDMDLDIEVSLDLLEPLHKRLVHLIKNLSDDELSRQYVHPEYNKTFDLNFTIAMYSWHSRHHHAHVLQALQFEDKFD